MWFISTIAYGLQWNIGEIVSEYYLAAVTLKMANTVAEIKH